MFDDNQECLMSPNSQMSPKDFDSPPNTHHKMDSNLRLVNSF